MTLLGTIGTGATVAITIKAIDEFSKAFSSANSGLEKIGKIGGAALVATATAVTGLGVAAVKLAGDFEQTTVAFTTMLGSEEQAKIFLEELAEFAKKTPFTLPGVEKSARQLLAVGFNAQDVVPVLTDVGNIAAGLGMGEDGLQRLILNLGQVQSQGKLTGRELRDFAVAGIPLLDELAKQLGVTTAQVSDMVSKGEIDTKIVLQSFNNMASEGGRFADLMKKQALTVQGKFSNLKDTVTLLGREMGTALLPVVGELADTFLTDVLPSLTPVIQAIGTFLQKALEKLAPFLPKIAEMFGEIVTVTLELFDALFPLLEPLFEIGEILFPIIMDAIKAIVPVIKTLSSVLGPLLEILSPVIELIGMLISGVAKISGGALEFLFGNFGSIFSGKKYNMTSVNDAIIRPNGDIIKTHPNDTIFATQSPESMGGITVYIDKVQGIDADEISELLAKKLSMEIRR